METNRKGGQDSDGENRAKLLLVKCARKVSQGFYYLAILDAVLLVIAVVKLLVLGAT